MCHNSFSSSKRWVVMVGWLNSACAKYSTWVCTKTQNRYPVGEAHAMNCLGPRQIIANMWNLKSRALWGEMVYYTCTWTKFKRSIVVVIMFSLFLFFAEPQQWLTSIGEFVFSWKHHTFSSLWWRGRRDKIAFFGRVKSAFHNDD